MSNTPTYFLSQLAELTSSSSGYLYFNSTTGAFSTSTPSSLPWSSLTGTPNTLAGYGISSSDSVLSGFATTNSVTSAIASQHTADVALFASQASLNPGSLLAANGYQKLPSGLILQWGLTVAIANGSTFTVTFPIAFPTACVFATDIPVTLNGAVAQSPPSANTFTTTGFNLTNTTGISNTYHWFAIGY